MKRLYLLRHATPEPEPSHDDAARPLSAAGRAEAHWIGERLRALEAAPPFALTSTARRALETLEGVCRGYGDELPCEAVPELYLASPERVIEAVEAQDDAREALLVVGHNPGLARLAYELLRESERDARERIAAGFRPASLAAIGLEIDEWVAVERGLGRALAVAAPDRG